MRALSILGEVIAAFTITAGAAIMIAVASLI